MQEIPNVLAWMDGVTQRDVTLVGVAQSGRYTPLLRELLALTLDKLGVFPDFQHQIELKPDMVPIACRPCPIPLALREGVENTVCELDRNGIWKPVEKSEWVLHLVTLAKPNGELCITTDFMPLNKSVIQS